MPDFISAVFKHLHFSIPVKKGLPSSLIASIEIEQVEIRLRREVPHPLITALVKTVIEIPRGLRKLKFLTTEIEADFYLLHPETSRRIARLQTDGWQESTNDKSDNLWKIEARVRDAPVEITHAEGFDDWFGMMIRHEGDEMGVSVEGWCSAGVKALKTKATAEKIPVKARLNIAGIPKPGQMDPLCQNDLRVIETGASYAVMTVHILVQNPTLYTIHIEYLHVHLYHNGVLIGEAAVTEVTMNPRSRVRALTKATFLPHGTDKSKASVGAFMSGYVCGKKTILEIRLHEHSIPSMPHLSRLLGENFAVQVAVPRLSPDQSSDEILETNKPSESFVPEDGKLGSPTSGLESPIILSATMNILSSTVQLTLFNPLNIPIHVSNVSSQAMHNTSHIGDLAVSDDWCWTLEPGVQQTPKVPVKWSIVGFGLDPMKYLSVLFDGWQRGGEVSVDVQAKASLKMDNLELGELEIKISGIATKIRI